MTITIVIIKPRQEIWLECGWRHAQKRWADNWEDFEKRFSWGPTMVLRSWHQTLVLRGKDLRLDHAGRQLSFCHWGRELSSLPLSWVFYRCGGDKVFRVQTNEDELRSKIPRDLPNIGSVVSIVWLRKTFKNCLSPCVVEPKSEVNNNKNVRTWTKVSACVFCICICTVVIVILIAVISLWLYKRKGNSHCYT